MAYSLLWSGPPPGCDRSGKPCLGRTCLQVRLSLPAALQSVSVQESSLQVSVEYFAQARKRHCRASGVRSDIEREVTAAQAGLILPRGSPGAWDTGCIGNPVVRRFDHGYTPASDTLQSA